MAIKTLKLKALGKILLILFIFKSPIWRCQIKSLKYDKDSIIIISENGSYKFRMRYITESDFSFYHNENYIYFSSSYARDNRRCGFRLVKYHLIHDSLKTLFNYDYNYITPTTLRCKVESNKIIFYKNSKKIDLKISLNLDEIDAKQYKMTFDRIKDLLTSLNSNIDN